MVWRRVRKGKGVKNEREERGGKQRKLKKNIRYSSIIVK